ncbi:RNA polymerase, sigma-24 subunit, ECF subfamily [Verrucomicrobia bacterium]|nr:RNA polymerase, sigma-24 subunit, ECF subfamily [Verrucomicrobiota bacterium]
MALNVQMDVPVQPQDNRDGRSDLQLIAAVNGGDAAAFEVLYLRHRDWVLTLACRFTGDSDAALDVLQETFLYFLKKFPGFRLTCHLKTFLYPAVRHLSIAARRKAARYQGSLADLEQIVQSAAPAQVPSQTTDLVAALAALTEEHREVLLLRFVDGLNLAEIAQAVQIPLGTVKSRLHNALQTLREDARTHEFFGR